MRILLAGSLFAAAMTLAMPPLAEAAPPPRVKGLNCRTLAKQIPASSMWTATFRGNRIGHFDIRESTFQVKCFKSQADCKAWVYWIQSDWPLENQVKRCRKGKP